MKGNLSICLLPSHKTSLSPLPQHTSTDDPREGFFGLQVDANGHIIIYDLKYALDKKIVGDIKEKVKLNKNK